LRSFRAGCFRAVHNPMGRGHYERPAAAFGTMHALRRQGCVSEHAERRTGARPLSVSGRPLAMCNLYSITKGQAAIRNLARAMRDHAGNLPPLPGIFPDQMAPIVRTAGDGVRELLMMRWGFPSPPMYSSPRPVTN